MQLINVHIITHHLFRLLISLVSFINTSIINQCNAYNTAQVTLVGNYNTSLVSFINAFMINQCNSYNTSLISFINTSIISYNVSVTLAFTNLQNLSRDSSSFSYVNISNFHVFLHLLIT